MIESVCCLFYRFSNYQFQILLIKDGHTWTIPKSLIKEHESCDVAAKRISNIGFDIKTMLYLGSSLYTKHNSRLHGFATEVKHESFYLNPEEMQFFPIINAAFLIPRDQMVLLERLADAFDD